MALSGPGAEALWRRDDRPSRSLPRDRLVVEDAPTLGLDPVAVGDEPIADFRLMGELLVHKLASGPKDAVELSERAGDGLEIPSACADVMEHREGEDRVEGPIGEIESQGVRGLQLQSRRQPVRMSRGEEPPGGLHLLRVVVRGNVPRRAVGFVRPQGHVAFPRAELEAPAPLTQDEVLTDPAEKPFVRAALEAVHEEPSEATHFRHALPRRNRATAHHPFDDGDRGRTC